MTSSNSDNGNDEEVQDERERQYNLAEREKVNAFLDELSQLSRRHKLYIMGHGEDTFLVAHLTNPLGDYQPMWGSALGMPEEVCWCPGDDASREGQVDL